MANQFVPVDVRRRIARERTSTPTGGYRLANSTAKPTDKPEPVRSPAMRPPELEARPKTKTGSLASQSKATLGERLFEEKEAGKLGAATPLGQRPHLRIFKGRQI